MLSSLFSSIQSPKSLLANKLSASLADYFDVDPTAIKSNLVTDTKIVLSTVRLKPQTVCGSLLVGGVDSIEFSWKWGGSADGSTSFVRDAILSIRGAKFRVVAKAGATLSTITAAPVVTPNIGATTASPGLLDKYVRQIFDHLTLNITDAQVVVETIEDGQGELVIEMQALQLGSLGRRTESSSSSSSTTEEAPPPLSQRLALGLLRMYLQHPDGVERPVMDPFSYGTSIQRVSGRRFQGLTHGMEIVGDIMGNDGIDGGRIVLHAGREQMAALSKILSDLWDASAASAVTASLEPTALESMTLSSPVPLESTGPATTVRLPFPSVAIVLPNNAEIQLPHCELHHVMDGSICRLTGIEGIRANQQPWLEVANEWEWSVDLVTSTFSICPMPQTPPMIDGLVSTKVAIVTWDEEQMKLLVQGFLDLERESRALAEKGLEAFDNGIVDQSSSTWSVVIPGTVDVSVKGQCSNWIKASLQALSFSISSDSSAGWHLTDFTMDSAQIGPSSFGKLGIRFPPTVLDKDQSSLSTDGPVLVEVESFSVVETTQSFMSRVLDAGLASTECLASPDLPVGFVIPRLQFDMTSPNHTNAELRGIRISRNQNVTIDSIACSSDDSINGEDNGTMMSATGVVASVTPNMDVRASIAAVDRLYIPNGFSLTTPLMGMNVRFSLAEGFLVAMTSVNVELLESSGSNKPASVGVGLMFPVNCEIDELLYKILPGSADTSHVSGIQLNAKPFQFGETNGIHFCLDFLHHASKLVSIHDAKVSGVYGAPNTIANLNVTLATATVSAGFSSLEWKNVLRSKGQEETQPWNLPLARVAAFSAKVDYKGRIVSTASDLSISEFVGSSECTSDEIIKYMTNATIRQIPSFFGNVKVLGASGRDMGASTVGQIALGAGVAGSVVGLVAVDSVRGAVALGKQSRGESSSEGYKFGDLTRGTLTAIKQAAKTGSAMRGGDGSYQLGDLSAGAANSVGHYAGQNKQRLGSAGGSSLGMAAGALALGPIGLVAGCVLGGMAGAKAFGSSERDCPNSGEGSNTQGNESNNFGELDLTGQEHSEHHERQKQPDRTSNTDRSEGTIDLLYEVTDDPARAAYGEQLQMDSSAMHMQEPMPVAQPVYSFQPVNSAGHPLARTEVVLMLPTSYNHPVSFMHATTESSKATSNSSSTVAKGNKTSGHKERDGYKFGDFTRGLFSK
jgi:hypothetical protein